MGERDITTALRAFAHEGLRPCLSFLADDTWSLRVAGRSFKADTIEEVVERAAHYALRIIEDEGRQV